MIEDEVYVECPRVNNVFGLTGWFVVGFHQ